MRMLISPYQLPLQGHVYGNPSSFALRNGSFAVVKCVDKALILEASDAQLVADLSITIEPRVMGGDARWAVSRLLMPLVVDDCVRVACADLGIGACLNRLPMSLTTSPGCIPKDGLSKLTVLSQTGCACGNKKQQRYDTTLILRRR